MQYNPDKNIELSDLLSIFVKLVRPWHCNPLFSFDKIDMRPVNFKITGRNSKYRNAFHNVGSLRWFVEGMVKFGAIIFKGVYNSK